ncbi:tetrathionate reductase family octaheme c-type cytochrome [Halorhodospira halochloris]|uniref:tetrathionate reductase family octaheme c-type cytochrome n=1 Tax=Halorhodospira halochloris TaxID=1052 RepID=UPI001EE86456|nr:tetrathionate reductase family octaheme c-type cytochrome [Halorhodospira halochloris]MCG5530615.1 tetrathionate reductase family octaheme c-type cytochrome [Halorhodospira halochloris]MCG5547803.1 tetrathionate reductase family octaheme c-type cytochrome [Halorhodospira halochloris]
MIKTSRTITAGLFLVVNCLAAANADHTPLDTEAMLDPAPAEMGSTADHSKFEQLEGPFEDATEVTAACLECHTEAAKQVHSSIHWHYEFQQPETEQDLGKKNVINNLCFGIAGNYERCSSCHVGYGWEDHEFDFTAEEQVDCLVCHDTTGSYVKFPTSAGHPPYEDREFHGETIAAPDLAEVAQNVGPSSRETCGTCHFEGGGGDAVKHGDLDSSLIDPPYELDVHMSPEGADFTCSTCHTFSGHIQLGSRYKITMPEDERPVAADPHQKPACEACHGSEPHDSGIHDKLNQHSEFIACETCHVPEVARGGKPTRTLWDWSESGRMDDDGDPVVETEDGVPVYDGRKGRFEWREDYAPEYHWFDGNMHYTLLDDEIDPTETVTINRPMGDHDTPGAKIWPFTSMKGRQPYDKEHKTLLTAHLFGDEPSAYWQSYDWSKALAAGMEEAQKIGQTEKDFSGEYGFVDSIMHWPVAHMIAPAEDSLSCQSCHEPDGRMAGLEGLYVPGQDSHPRIERIGWWAIGLTLLAVLGHGSARYLLYRHKRSKQENSQEEAA